MIELRDVTKTFKTDAGTFTALDRVNIRVDAGEFVAIVGKSGSGKSTLINMITGIYRPSSGVVRVADKSIQALTEDQIAQWRGATVGVIFQFFQLLPTLTILENILLPMDFQKRGSRRESKERAMEVLRRVGIVEQADKLPSALSGGQQQRAAIARALANDPPIIIADEPTGNLDSKTADHIFGLFKELVASGKTLVMVTHERDVTTWVSRTITLADGLVVES